jgi:hypothetical protein
MATTTQFGIGLRVLACDSCGAPMHVAIGGGAAECRYCRATNRVAQRAQTSLAYTASAIPEPERLVRLRSQDGRPLLPPPSLGPLFEAGDIPAWRMDEAIRVWNSSRQEVRATGSYEAAERVYFLTMVLAQKFSLAGDLDRQRAMLESASECLTLPRHKQVMWAYLARAAVRSGDAQAAQDWLSQCNPRSDDLESDSAYRMAAALVHTARHEYPQVLAALGAGPNDIPIHDAMDDACAVLRANAHERMGNLPAAVAVLGDRMNKGAEARMTVEKSIQAMSYLQVCPQSFAMALGQHTAQAAGSAGAQVTGGAHKILLGMGILFAVIGGLLIIGGIIAAATGSMEALPGLGLTGIIFVPTGLGLTFWGRNMQKQAAEAAWLRVNGLRARARITGVQGTGLEVNGVPQILISMQVMMEGRAPFVASAKRMGAGVPIGAEVAVRVHPQDQSKVIIEAD